MTQISVMILLLLGALIFNTSDPELFQRNKNRYLAFSLIALGLLSSLRHYGVGVDTYTYKYLFDKDSAMSWGDVFDNFRAAYVDGVGKDAGYTLLVKIFQIFSTEYRAFLFFVSFVFNYALYRFLKNNTKTIRESMLALVIFVVLLWTFTMAGIRQTLAMALCIWGFEMIKQKKLFQFLPLMIVAATLHKSALIFIPFYFFARVPAKFVYITTALILPLVFYYLPIIALNAALIMGDEQLMGYVTENRANSGTPIFTLMMGAVFVAGSLNLKGLMRDKSNVIFINSFVLAMLFGLLSWIDSSLIRLSMFFSIYMIVFIPRIINTVTDNVNSQHAIYLGLIVILCCAMIFQSQQLDYNFMWQDMALPEKWR